MHSTTSAVSVTSRPNPPHVSADKGKVFMTYQDKPEKAAEYLRQVIPLLSKYKVPATPINYSVWYNYVAGNQLALNEALNNVIEREADHG